MRHRYLIRTARRQGSPVKWLMTVAIASCLLSGCAALTNPVADGLPVHLLPPELRGEAREDKIMLPLTQLRQKPPKIYRLAAGDILGVYIEGVLGERGGIPPITDYEGLNRPPGLGFPIPVREDGTVPLPLVDPISVSGLSISEAEQRIIETYTVKHNILKMGRERIIVTLYRPRQTRVLVIRQDAGSGGGLRIESSSRLTNSRGGLGGISASFGSGRTGTGTIVDLPAYQNDVLNALAYTGGLPGSDAVNEVVIQRGYANLAQHQAGPADGLEIVPLPSPARDPNRAEIIRIPLRIYPGEQPPFRPEDIILKDGDIVLIEGRDAELFYTGGLLPAGEWPVPRDYDLDVVEAVMQVQGPLVNGGVNSSNLSGAIVAPGLGSPSPKLVTVIRTLPDKSQARIRVDLNRAMRDPRENLIVQAGDVLIMQETKGQAVARYVTQVFNFSILSELFETSSTTGSIFLGVP